jgi:hypothetical protein
VRPVSSDDDTNLMLSAGVDDFDPAAITAHLARHLGRDLEPGLLTMLQETMTGRALKLSLRGHLWRVSSQYLLPHVNTSGKLLRCLI